MKPKSCIIGVLLLLAALRGVAQDGAANIEFVENKGQWDKQVDFRGDVTGGAFYLQRTGFTVLLHNLDEMRGITETHRGQVNPVAGGGVIAKQGVPVFPGGGTAGGSAGGSRSVKMGRMGGMVLHSQAYRVSFLGASDQVEVIPDKPIPSYNNYFIGNDPSKWASKCKIYQGVTYKNIYPNVDIRYYTDKGQLKYDIIIHPGGDADQIAMRYEGMDKLSTKKNELLIGTSAGQVKELSPASFQSDERGRTEVSCKYMIKDGNTVRFKLGDHSPGATLIIDPTLVFCTFTGSKVTNWGFTATPGPDGSFYSGSIVFGNGFPFSPGVVQPSDGGGTFDIGIMKFNTIGTLRVYATYLGGNGDETPHSMICDAQGNLIVMGHTYSTNFPFKTRVGVDSGGAEMFVAKFNADGSNLIGCMRIGGRGDDCVNIADQFEDGYEHAESLIRNYGDDSRSEVVLDGENNILVAASTQSATDFPITPGVFQPNFGGGLQDGVVLKINSDCNTLIWSSFLGGSGDDGAFVLKPDLLTGNIYVGGATTSTDFPGDKTNVIQSTYGGGVCDGFLTEISGDGTTQIKTTYLGTAEADAIYGVEIDKQGIPYIMGTTNGSWPVINAPYFNAGAKQFVGKIQPDLSAYIYSMTFGSSSALPNISPVAFLVDRCENVYVSGWGGWIFARTDPYGLSGTLGMKTTPDAIQPSTDNRDFYFIVLKKDVTGILYGTFFGQVDNANSISEHVDGGTSRYDQNGVIYQAICANCNGMATTRFPTTYPVWARDNGAGSDGCNLAAVKIAFNFAGVTAGLKTTVNGRPYDTSGCVPLDAVFQDTVRNAKSYIWNFGDGSPDTPTTGYIVSHNYPNVGVYLVRLIAIDSTSCNGMDTVYTHVIARNDKAQLNFDYAKDGPCESLAYLFTNLSTAPPGKPFGNNSFEWIFGDLPPGSATIPAGPVSNTISHTFASPGTYIVSLVLTDTNYCNYPDTLPMTLRISPLVKAQFVTPAAGCAPYTAVFNNTSLGGEQFTWDFGDGSVSTDPSPTHVYADTGTYTVHLTVVDTTTCNKRDSTEQTILVSTNPKPGFSFEPHLPIANTPTVFTNSSSGGIKYEWLFGDGTSETKNNLDTAEHLYNQTDTFQACLVVINQYGCADTTCQGVAAVVDPLLDVPNAFTPGRFGENAVVKVMGFGITHMIFKIYNRWGQLVFETNDPNVGWDGTFKGVVQPMDVYAYTVEATFSDGKQANKKGDITLIR